MKTNIVLPKPNQKLGVQPYGFLFLNPAIATLSLFVTAPFRL